MPSEAELIQDLKSADCELTSVSPEFIISTSDVEQVKGIFRQHGMSFAVRNSQVNVAARLLWTCKDIEYFGKPFQVLKRTKLECKYGMIRKPADENSAKFNHSFGKKKRNKPSKKTGCPAVMKITEIILYPEFAIDTSIEKNVANVERMKMKELRQTLDTTADVPTEKRYFITVSKPSDHNHSVWISPLTQPLKPQLKTPKKKKVKAKETVPSDSQTFFATEEIIYDYDLSEFEPSFSQSPLSQLRETAKSILDLTYLIQPEDHDLSRVQTLLSSAEQVLKSEFLVSESDIAASKKC